jgi:SSS family solute:Na+ symporter
MLLGRYYGSGMLGLGLTALLASFMSGMAGNVTAFNTVFTYDLYQTYLVKNKPDSHYLKVGRWATVWGTLLSCASAYIALYFDNLMDYMQLLGALSIAPFFIVFFLGMFWKRVSPTAAFYGIVAGMLACSSEYILYRVGVLHFKTPMASNVWTSVWAFAGGSTVTVVATLLTKPPDITKLKGLTYAYSARLPRKGPWYRTPEFYAVAVGLAFVFLNWKFF